MPTNRNRRCNASFAGRFVAAHCSALFAAGMLIMCVCGILCEVVRNENPSECDWIIAASMRHKRLEFIDVVEIVTLGMNCISYPQTHIFFYEPRDGMLYDISYYIRVAS